jgi:hypothetical protein
MVGKFPPWERENGRKKTSVWWEISLRGRENVFRCMEPLVLRHLKPVFQSLNLAVKGLSGLRSHRPASTEKALCVQFRTWQ